MADIPILEFSQNADYLAYSDPTGVIKIWDTSIGTLKQEYAPSSHLSVTCTCISWCPKSSIRSKESSHKKKRKSSNQSDNLDLVAFGTSSGNILLYSSRQSALLSQLCEGHTDKVTGISWDENGDELYSCSTDRHIVHWDVNNTKKIHRWTSTQGELHSIHLCHSQTHLLTASHTIELWDLQKHQVIQTFTGHTTAVFRLLEVPVFTSNHVTNGNHSLEGHYIVSAAQGENKISVRQIGTKSKVTDIVASFLLIDEPCQISIQRQTREDQPFQMVAVTRIGHLSYFECVLNGRQKKPFKAVHTTSVVSNDELSRTLPMTAAAFTSPNNILITYEDFLRPVFEKIKVSDMKDTIIRENPKKCKISKQDDVSKVRFPTISNDIKVISGSNAPINLPVNHLSKKRKKNTDLQELTLEERGATKMPRKTEVPKNLNKNQANSISSNKISGDSFCVLLTQGLQSEDKNMINSVLQRQDENIIRATLTSLSLPTILILVNELQRRLMGHATSGRIAMKWLKILIELHSSFLLTVPSVGSFISEIISKLETPIDVFSKLLHLKGKLDAIVSQMSLQSRQSDGEEKAALFELSTGVSNNGEDFLIVEDVRNIAEEDEWSENEEELEPLNDDVMSE